jgi:hypothetical protein
LVFIFSVCFETKSFSSKVYSKGSVLSKARVYSSKFDGKAKAGCAPIENGIAILSLFITV